jgi:ribosomal protein L11 methyltransferase
MEAFHIRDPTFALLQTYHRSANIFDLPTTWENESAAQLRSITFRNIDKQNEPDVLCDFILELGACSVSMTDADRDTDMEEPMFGEPTFNEDERLLWLPPVWNHCHVTAHFPASTQLETLVETVQDFLGSDHPSLSYQLEVVPNRDWIVHVQQSWKPIVVANRFLLTFPWHNQTQIQNDYNMDRLIPLTLQGGVAFGTGEHPTTQLCMEWLSMPENIPSSDHPLVFLDYGSGSGILGMSAAKVHPQLSKIVGIDLDVDACLIANANARINHIDMRNYLPPLEWFVGTNEGNEDSESKSLVYKAYARVGDHSAVVWSSDEGDEQASPFPLCDVCVANILAAPLMQLAPLLLKLLRPGAKLGMSGILASQEENVIRAFEEAGFGNVHRPQPVQAGWVLLQAEKP